MNQWFFSSNGEVTSALSYEEAKAFLNNNPNAYGWNSSFKQWKPVSCIHEFAGVIPATPKKTLISQENIEKFQAKKLSLESKVTTLEDSIKHSLMSLSKFAQQIQDYKELTCHLNQNVKSAIDNIEGKYETLSSKLTHFKEALEIAKTEMSEVVGSFNRKMKNNDILMPTCEPSSSVHYLPFSNVDNSIVHQSQLVQQKLAKSQKTDEVSISTKTRKTASEFNKAKKSTESSETITKVYRGVEYQVQKQL